MVSKFNLFPAHFSSRSHWKAPDRHHQNQNFYNDNRFLSFTEKSTCKTEAVPVQYLPLWSAVQREKNKMKNLCKIQKNQTERRKTAPTQLQSTYWNHLFRQQININKFFKWSWLDVTSMTAKFGHNLKNVSYVWTNLLQNCSTDTSIPTSIIGAPCSVTLAYYKSENNKLQLFWISRLKCM